MKTLVLIDLQNDFCPGGALAVEQGNETVIYANSIINNYDLVIAAQDSHPAGHKSFASTHGLKPGETIQIDGNTQILWPDHCVIGTKGHEFHSELNKSKINHVVIKGTDLNIDSYSAFFDNAQLKKTEMDSLLKINQVKEIDLMGLATDYCVLFSVLDALSLGYKTNVLMKGCRGVELNQGDVKLAIEQMRKEGGNIIY